MISVLKEATGVRDGTVTTPSNSVVMFETYSIDSIAYLNQTQPSKWIDLQSTHTCCGVVPASRIQWFIDPEVC